ncbi:MAG: hypothetical protein C5B58_08385 [Acidobacteria bacterium]|nr:MAG: hypothetical protein C5B58_08385 [Acidobacteriota bacterium]
MAQNAGAEKYKIPVQAAVQPKHQVESDLIGNVVVTYADGTTDLWTLKGNCKLPKVSSGGAVGWVVCEMQPNSSSLKLYDDLAIGSSLTVNFRGRIVANLRAAKPFIEDWAFDTDGHHVIVKSRLAHGTAMIERFGLHDGPPEAAVKAYQEDLPDWAQEFGEGSSENESTAKISEPAVTVHDDAAAIKKRLVGTWKAYDETIVLKSDGTRITSGTDSSGRFSVREKWDVRGGNYIEVRTPPKVIVITPSSLSRRTNSCSRIMPMVVTLALGLESLNRFQCNPIS